MALLAVQTDAESQTWPSVLKLCVGLTPSCVLQAHLTAHLVVGVSLGAKGAEPRLGLLYGRDLLP